MNAVSNERNPLSEFALTRADLLDPANYHPDPLVFNEEEWLPFIVVDGKEVTQDAFTHRAGITPYATEAWTWETENSDSSSGIDLRVIGIIPWEDGTWSSSYVVANAKASKLIAQLLANT